MTPVNLKDYLMTLPDGVATPAGEIRPFFDENKELTHKHVEIGGKWFIRTKDLQWFEGECEICKL